MFQNQWIGELQIPHMASLCFLLFKIKDNVDHVGHFLLPNPSLPSGLCRPRHFPPSFLPKTLWTAQMATTIAQITDLQVKDATVDGWMMDSPMLTAKVLPVALNIPTLEKMEFVTPREKPFITPTVDSMMYFKIILPL
jgi:hypothetical protein